MSTQINIPPHCLIVLLFKTYIFYRLKCVQLVNGQQAHKVKERISYYQQLSFKIFK